MRSSNRMRQRLRVLPLLVFMLFPILSGMAATSRTVKEAIPDVSTNTSKLERASTPSLQSRRVLRAKEHGFNFIHSSDWQVFEWQGEKPLLYSVSLTKPAWLLETPYQPPEISVSVISKEKSLTVEEWLSEHLFDNEENFALSGTSKTKRYYGRRAWDYFSNDQQGIIVYEHEALGVPITTTLIDVGTEIISLSAAPYEAVEEEYLEILDSLRIGRGQTKVLDKTQLKQKVEHIHHSAKIWHEERKERLQESQEKKQELSAWFPAAYADQLLGYKLPWVDGKTVTVLQGWDAPSGSTHVRGGMMDRAYDFGFNEGEELRAARAGTVAFVQVGKTRCGGSELANEGNYVVINHTDGKSTQYLHLKSVDVAKGDQLKQGDRIGTAGKTGWTFCDTHLHFQRQSVGASWFGKSEAIYFDEYPGQELSKGIPYTSQNTRSVVCSPGRSNPWTVSKSCTLSGNHAAYGDVIVQNDSVLTIDSGAFLDINFTSYKLLVKQGSGVLVKSGGKIN